MSAKHFVKDLEDYLVDTELTETDRRRITAIFERHVNVEPKVIIKEVIKEVPKIRIIRDAVYLDREKILYVEKETGKLIRPTPKKKKGFTTDEECQRIMYEVCNMWSVSYEDLISKSRNRRLCYARYFCYKILYQMGLTLTDIGNMFAGRDHTTVISGLRESRNLIEQQVNPFYLFWNRYQVEVEKADKDLETCEKCGKLL